MIVGTRTVHATYKKMHMSDTPFSDELLNEVLDGTAPDETVDAVQRDAAARARLSQLQRVQELVATPPPAAPTDRRAQSISAALAAAEPVEGVTSLTTARVAKVEKAAKRRQFPLQWAAAAAAVVALGIGIPVVLSGGLGDDDTATTAESSRSLSDDADDAADGSDEAAATIAASDTAAADLAGVEAEIAETARASAAEFADDGATVTGDAASDDAEAPDDQSPQPLLLLSTVDELPLNIENGLIEPTLAIDDPVLQDEVMAECLDQFADIDDVLFSLVRIEPIDETPYTALIVFDPDGSVQTLNSEDCTLVG